MADLSEADPTSFSRPDEAVVTHTSLSLSIDFTKKVLSGTAVLTINLKTPDVKVLKLDTSDLIIKSVYIPLGEKLDYEYGNIVANIGQPLIIQLPISTAGTSSQKLLISIDYKTSPNASGLQWLTPEQTFGKNHPFLFSSFQAIHARSAFPCQDTPSVKFTYDAQIEALSQYTVLMSAIRDPNVEMKGINSLIHRFKQRIPIPSYLVAIAAGALESREISPRCKVWSEVKMVERCAFEFSETERMLTAAEDLCGPYVWGDYDLLVLPPSFPYGGMENPCLTFVTPTTIAGDRSLADVIVHEIAHSWTGNLVTNANFEHFWLNEGFTVFVERKVSAKLNRESYSEKEFRDFSSLQGLQTLRETVVDELGLDNPLTKLVVNLTGLNPDDAFSSVPYEKGSIFLRYLEDLFGGPEVFDPFLRYYIKEFKEKSIETNDFKKCMISFFKEDERLQQVDWDAWLYNPGMPPVIPEFDTKLFDVCTALAKIWQGEDLTLVNEATYTAMSPAQKITFYQLLLDGQKLSIPTLTILMDTYKPQETQNSEIKFRWLRLCIKSEWPIKINEALQFVNEQGRMKFVRPIYRDLYAWNLSRLQTIDNFNKNKQLMMHVCAYSVGKDIKIGTKG